MEKKSYLCNMEIWKDIKGYEGYYQVSSLGNIKRVNGSIKCNGVHGIYNKIVSERLLVPVKTSNKWYLSVNLSKDNNKKIHDIHRLVAEAFIANPNKYPVVMHIDNNGYNNCVDNLMWGTYKMNNIQPVIEKRAANQYGKYK